MSNGNLGTLEENCPPGVIVGKILLDILTAYDILENDLAIKSVTL